MPTNDQGVTVQRQYIGARYVPKFFQGTDGSSNWIANIPYEPLTIVTYLGNSYTSKIPVPSGIGSPNNNPTYWALTGNFNEQINSYREEVEQLDQNVSTLENNLSQTNQAVEQNTSDIESILNNPIYSTKRRYVFIGDSYNTSTTPSGGTQIIPWGPQLAQKLNAGAGDWYSYGQGGIGWVKSTTYLGLLQQNFANINNPNTISDIVVLGGVNDVDIPLADISEAIDEFYSYCKENFPNAKIWSGAVSWAQSLNVKTLITNIDNLLLSKSEKITYIAHAFNFLHNYDFIQIDGIHPNQSGTESIVNNVANILKNLPSSPIWSYTTVQQLVNDPNGGIPWATLGAKLVSNMCGDSITLEYIWTTNYTSLSPCKFLIGGDLPIGEFNSPLARTDKIFIWGHGTGFVRANGTKYPFTYNLTSSGTNMFLNPSPMDGSAPSTIENVTEIYLTQPNAQTYTSNMC